MAIIIFMLVAFWLLPEFVWGLIKMVIVLAILAAVVQAIH